MISIIFLRPVASYLSIVDKPSKRKKHIGEVPLTGGIGIFIGLLATLFFDFAYEKIYKIYLLGSLFILIIGFWDDCKPLSVSVRLVAQIIIISLVIWFMDIKLETLGHSFGFEKQINFGIFAFPITVLGIVFVTNIFNLMDGLDGLAGSLALLAIFGINLVYFFSIDYAFNPLTIALAACLIAFLFFNLSKKNEKKIFLGDSGSYLIGFTVSFLLLYECQYENKFSSPYAIWTIAIPIIDTIATLIYRIKNSLPIFKPDKNHLHYFLESLSISKSKVLFIFMILGLLLTCVGIIFEYNFKLFSLPAFLLLLILYILFRIFYKKKT